MSTRIYLFGSPRLEENGNSVEIHRRKALALLAYVAVSGQPQSRDGLATMLWPEYDQSSARANLRRDLSRLRAALSKQVLRVNRAQIEVDPEADVWLDVDEFRRLLAEVRAHEHPAGRVCTDCMEKLRAAATLQADSFMAGFTLPDAPEFDEWQFFQREDLQQKLGEVLQQLIAWQEQHGEYEQAITHARQWLALDTLHEPAHRKLMQLYAWAGQHAAALRQYNECVRILDEELGVEPEAETKALYEAVRLKKVAPPEPAGAAPAPDVLPPEERYVRESLLAVGGHGELYLGRDEMTGEQVVIKRLRPGLIVDNPELVTRFAREGEALRQLDHPNIVKMLATFERDGEHCIVMEYVPGGSLHDLIAREGPLPVERVLDIALELADALIRAHHRDIIHRDLKPDNILLAEDGTPRLTDFGLVRLQKEDVRLTQTGHFLGSPAYVSPETLRGAIPDARSDIWSFGVLLFEMLTGRRPFTEERLTPLLVSILEESAPDARELRADIPPALSHLLSRMLVKDPEERLASMRLVAAELEAIRAGDHDLRTAVQPGTRRVAQPAAVVPARPPTSPPAQHLALQQRIRYCTTADGVRLAYAVAGEGPVLVKTANWLSHLQFDWNSPVWRHWMSELAGRYTLVRYDERGCGLSDWFVDELSVPAFVRDLETVVDTLGLERFPLLGVSQGGAVAISYAVRHPEKVSHLILYGAYARGRGKRPDLPGQEEVGRAMLEMIRAGWGQDDPAFRQFFTNIFMPEASPQQTHWFNDLQRISTAPEVATRLMKTVSDIDVLDMVPQVTVPTLILHGRDDKAVPFREAELLRELIPHARFVPLPSQNHILLAEEPAWPQFLEEVERFLAEEHVPRVSPVPAEPAVSLPRPAPRRFMLYNVPAQSTPLVGREEELAALQALLERPEVRLVSIVAYGGMGKTRLALALAQQAGGSAPTLFSDGVAFVPLPGVDRPEAVPAAIAQALQISLAGAVDPLAGLASYLRERRMLLILDSYEQLVADVEPLNVLLLSCPGVKLLVTSRIPLQMFAEWRFDLEGLTCPAGTGTDASEDEVAAVQLFMQTARQVRGDFALTAATRPCVYALCRLLDGMPLAIRLAASWLQVMSCADILEEVTRNMDILRSTMRDLPPRQSSLRAVFEHTWSLLAAPEQEALRALAVFPGPFSAAAAATVAGTNALTLAALVDRGLLHVHTGRGGARYQVHGMVRHYAVEKLAEEPALQRQVSEAHTYYYADFMREREQALRQGEQSAEVRAEIDNVRAGWRYAVAHGLLDALQGYHWALAIFLWLQGSFAEAYEIFYSAVSMLRETAGAEPELQVLLTQLLVHCAAHSQFQGQLQQAGAALDEAWEVAEPLGDIALQATVLDRQARLANERGDLGEAIRLGQRVLEMYNRLGDDAGVARTLAHLGAANLFRHEFAQAQQHLEEALLFFRQRHLHSEVLIALGYLAGVHLKTGNYAQARTYLQELAALNEEMKTPTHTTSLNTLGHVFRAEGDYEQARYYYEQSLAFCRKAGNEARSATPLSYLGYLDLLAGDYEAAEQQLQQSVAINQKYERRRQLARDRGMLGRLALLRGDVELAREQYQRSYELYQELGRREGTAIALNGLARTALAAGEVAEAREQARQALQLAYAIGATPLVLQALLSMALLLRQEGEKREALFVVSFVLAQAAATQEVRDEAQRLAGHLSAAFPPSENATVQARAREMALAEVVEHYLEEE